MLDLHLQLLGGFRLFSRGLQISLPSRCRELVACVAIQPSRAMRRPRLAGNLWPDSVDEQARRNLSTCIWRTRKILSAFEVQDLLIVSSQLVALDPKRVTVDHWEFERMARSAVGVGAEVSVYTAAVDLYKGDLLEGECESEWLIGEREHIRGLFLRVLHSGALALARENKPGDALRLFERLMECDPLNEECCRDAMQLYHSLGRTAEATRVFGRLSERLQTELGLPPAPETLALRDKIRRDGQVRTGEPFYASTRAREWPMVGRKGELEQLDLALRSVQEGKLSIVAIEGEAGIGKTRIVDEFVRVASQSGCRVFRTSCEDIPKATPYSAISKVLGSTVEGAQRLHEIASIQETHGHSASRGGSKRDSPPHSPRAASEERVMLLESLAAWIRGQAASGAALLVLEDAHLADSASLDFVEYLADALAACRVMIVLTWRTDECPPKIAEIAKPGGIFKSVITLSRMSRDEIRAVCEGFLGCPLTTKTTESVFRESEGNPLFAIEIVKSMTNLGGGPPTTGETQLARTIGGLGRGVLPWGIQSAVRRRLNKLPPEAMRVLNVACACGRRLDLELLRRVLGVSWKSLSVALGHLTRAGFVGMSGVDNAFSHDRIRVFCYDELAPSARLLIHRDVLKVLENHWPQRVGELAFHAERAGERAKASVYWEKLGDRASEIWAHRDAVAAYSKALENCAVHGSDRSPVEEYELLDKREGGFEAMGEMESAENDIKRMAHLARRLGDDTRLCESLVVESRVQLRRGMFREAGQTAREALRVARAVGSDVLRVRARELLANSAYRLGHRAEARNMFLDLVPDLERIGDYECLERVWNRIASLQSGDGDPDAINSLDRAENFSRGDLNERGIRNLQRGLIVANAGIADEARTDFQLAERDFRRIGNPSGQALANVGLALVDGCSGDFVSAIKRARKGLPYRCGRTQAHWRVVSSTNVCHGVLIGLGSFALARRLAARALRGVPQLEGQVKGNLLDLFAVLCLETGDLASAHDYALEALQEALNDPSPAIGTVLSTLGRINLALGHFDRAANLLRSAAEMLSSETDYLSLVPALSNLALALARLGKLAEARECSDRAYRLLVEHHWFACRPQEILWNHYTTLLECGDPAAPDVLDKAYRIVARQAAQFGRRMRERFLSVWVNRDITEAWEKSFGRGVAFKVDTQSARNEEFRSRDTTRVALVVPRTGAPWGRPLKSGELVEVILTLEAGRQDEVLKRLSGEVGLRRSRVLRLCAEANVQGGDLREGDLSRVLGVSTRTIRSDLAFLRARGCNVQTRGSSLQTGEARLRGLIARVADKYRITPDGPHLGVP